jgi:hypothetical protein
MKTNINLRQEIITLIRGYFLTPVIANLAKNNFFKNKKFLKVNNYSEKILVSYLKNLGFVKEYKNKFIISKKGKKIFSRSGSFNIVNSYRDYLFNLDKILDNPKILSKINCDRKENVLGSGSTNYRKFFKPALGLLKKNDFDVIHDLGCGNGNFLKNINLKFKNKELSGSDLSKISIIETKKNLNSKNVKLVQSDALNVKKWANWLIKEYDPKKQKILVSMWFVIHEISKKDVFKIINFFKEIKKKIPEAKILIGEIIEPEKKLLEKNTLNTIMPEYILFHQLSGQGIFSYDELKFILNKIPYKCSKKIEIDNIRFKNKENPSGIVWLLEPKN